MRNYFSRNDTSLLARWWWTIDRWSLTSLGLLTLMGAILLIAASPAVAERIGLPSYHFVFRQFFYLIPSIFILITISLMSPTQIKQLALLIFSFAIIGLILTPIMGSEIKGAKRWIGFFGFTFQPSEFAKPAFAVLSAWLINKQLEGQPFAGKLFSFLLYLLIIGLLLLQPDIGMAVVISGIWVSQFFIAGLAYQWIALLGCMGIVAILLAYNFFPHATQRIDQFLDSQNLSYQVEKSLEAFTRGGVFGRGPGEGRVKELLPDAHADFIYAVAGEEFGLLPCLFIIVLFAIILIRSTYRLFKQNNSFIILAAAGLLMQFVLQALINMGSTLHLIPTKGMTLPFISYGGSSLIALAINLGMMLALTRYRGDSGERFLKQTESHIIRRKI
jgi:cell division protein FtsW